MNLSLAKNETESAFSAPVCKNWIGFFLTGLLYNPNHGTLLPGIMCLSTLSHYIVSGVIL